MKTVQVWPIEIAYRNEETKQVYKEAGIQTSGSAGFDLCLAEDVKFEKNGEFKLLDLGVVIRVPEGHHSILMPRSSTFKKYKILQANSIGLIDNDYCGKDDFWMLASVYLGEEPIVIPKGTRICQFILQKTVPIGEVVEFDPSETSRGGFGSTGA